MRKTYILSLLVALLFSTAATGKAALFPVSPLAEEALARVAAGPVPMGPEALAQATPGASGGATALENRTVTGSFQGRVISEQSIRPFVDAAEQSRNSGFGAIFGLNILVLD